MEGVDSEDENSKAAAAILLQNRILLPYEQEAMEVLQYLEKAGDTLPSGAKHTLINRWNQIRDMIQKAFIIYGVRNV